MFIGAVDINRGEIPLKFDLSAVQIEKDAKNCRLCYEPFVMIKRTRKNCKKCGICICKLCCINKMPLSIEDEKQYRVCNKCFAIRTNQPIINFY
jgi:hypothetical protein